jgi:putative membrane protein insertion efficiency factor
MASIDDREEANPPPVLRRSKEATGVRFVTMLVHVYRATLGHFLGGRCRFEPSCSQYMIDAVRKHGAVRGAWRGLKRIGRCHPLSRGGYDPA